MSFNFPPVPKKMDTSSTNTSRYDNPPKYVRADTWRLDMLLSSALSDMVQNALESLLGPVKTLAILPEIQLGIDSCLYLVPSLYRLPTPGQRVLGLQYRYTDRRDNTLRSFQVSRRRTLSMGLMLLATYCFKKFKQYSRQYGWDELPLSDSRYHYTIIMHIINCIVSITKVWMALRFIVYGDYVTYTDRLSKLQLVYQNTSSSSSPSLDTSSSSLFSSSSSSSSLAVVVPSHRFRRPQIFDTLALQILSNAASELVQSISTLTDWSYTYQYFVRLVRRNYRRISHRLSLFLWMGSSNPRNVESSTERVFPAILPIASFASPSLTVSNDRMEHSNSTDLFTPSASSSSLSSVPTTRVRLVPSIYKVPCVFCSSRQAIMPIQASPCQHTYCYFCLHSLLLQDPSYECPSCGEYIQSSKLLR